MPPKKKTPEETPKETLEEILGEKRLDRSNEELNAILSEDNLGEAYDQSNIPLLNKQHVLGVIPKWIKDYDNSCEARIENARNKILKDFLIQNAQELIEEYKVFIKPDTQEDPANPKAFRVDPMPIILGLKEDLTLLSFYQLVFEAGEINGLGLLSNKKFSQYAIEGRKVVIGRNKANRKRLGGKNKKEREKYKLEKQNKIQDKVNSLAKEPPYSTYDWTNLSDEVGKHFGLTGRRIRDLASNPFK